jgi:hypothetical protein
MFRRTFETIRRGVPAPRAKGHVITLAVVIGLGAAAFALFDYLSETGLIFAVTGDKPHAEAAFAYACGNGSLGIASDFLRFGVDPGTRHSRPGGALDDAIYADRINSVAFLVEHGVPADGYPGQSPPPLGYADSRGEAGIVAYLLAHGASVRDGRGVELLRSSRGKPAILALLRAAGAGG